MLQTRRRLASLRFLQPVVVTPSFSVQSRVEGLGAGSSTTTDYSTSV